MKTYNDLDPELFAELVELQAVCERMFGEAVAEIMTERPEALKELWALAGRFDNAANGQPLIIVFCGLLSAMSAICQDLREPSQPSEPKEAGNEIRVKSGIGTVTIH